MGFDFPTSIDVPSRYYWREFFSSNSLNVTGPTIQQLQKSHGVHKLPQIFGGKYLQVYGLWFSHLDRQYFEILLKGFFFIIYRTASSSWINRVTLEQEKVVKCLYISSLRLYCLILLTSGFFFEGRNVCPWLSSSVIKVRIVRMWCFVNGVDCEVTNNNHWWYSCRALYWLSSDDCNSKCIHNSTN